MLKVFWPHMTVP